MRDRNFLLLWSGQFVSDFGSQVSIFALPVIAVVALHASAMQVALLQSVEFAAIAVAAVFGGAIVDRHRRKRMMMATNAVRLIAMLTLPIAWSMGRLSLMQIFTCAVVCSVASVLFDTAYQAMLPSLAGRERLAEGSAKLAMSGSIAEAAGSSAGGAIVQCVGAPLAMIADVCTFAFSLMTLWQLRHAEDRPRRTPAENESAWFLRETAAGFRHVLSEPALRTVALCTATTYLGGAVVTSIFPVLVYRELHLSPAAFGLVMGVANVGMLGALVPRWLEKLVGTRSVLGGAIALSALGKMLYLAAAFAPIAAVALGRLLITFAGPMYDVTQQTFRVAFIPEPMMGRVAAAFRAITWAALPIGSLLGGTLAMRFGLDRAILIGSVLSLSALLWLSGRYAPRNGMKNPAALATAAG